MRVEIDNGCTSLKYTNEEDVNKILENFGTKDNGEIVNIYSDDCKLLHSFKFIDGKYFDYNSVYCKLPKEAREKVRSILKVYDRVYVVYEYGQYNVSPNVALKSSYGKDHRVIGEIKVDDIYTLEEKTENYIESFHDYPIWYKGARDYKALKERFENK